MEKLHFVITEKWNGERIDKCISILINSFSRSFIQKMIKEEYIYVNGNVVKTNYRVSINDEIDVLIPENTEPDILPEDIPLTILYEDTDLLVVDKPKGMVVHPAPGHYTQTLVNAVMHHCKEQLSGINGVMRPGIVHRIDRDTTGSIIVCKSDIAHIGIAEQLKEHSIIRKYHAIVYGVLKEQEGTINAPIGRHPNDRKKMAINRIHGKDAITHYKVLKYYKNYTYIECQLETGRTHQIRVHMASIGYPLLGDSVYSNRRCPYPLEGQTLHAKTLGFIHPRIKQYVELDAELPAYFIHLLEIME